MEQKESLRQSTVIELLGAGHEDEHVPYAYQMVEETARLLEKSNGYVMFLFEAANFSQEDAEYQARLVSQGFPAGLACRYVTYTKETKRPTDPVAQQSIVNKLLNDTDSFFPRLLMGLDQLAHTNDRLRIIPEIRSQTMIQVDNAIWSQSKERERQITELIRADDFHKAVPIFKELVLDSGPKLLETVERRDRERARTIYDYHNNPAISAILVQNGTHHLENLGKQLERFGLAPTFIKYGPFEDKYQKRYDLLYQVQAPLEFELNKKTTEEEWMIALIADVTLRQYASQMIGAHKEVVYAKIVKDTHDFILNLQSIPNGINTFLDLAIKFGTLTAIKGFSYKISG
jgi:hypothetical protein